MHHPLYPGIFNFGLQSRYRAEVGRSFSELTVLIDIMIGQQKMAASMKQCNLQHILWLGPDEPQSKVTSDVGALDSLESKE